MNPIQCTPAQLAGLLAELASIVDVVQGRLQQLSEEFADYANVVKAVEETGGKVIASTTQAAPSAPPAAPAEEPAATAQPLTPDDLISAFKRTAGRIGPDQAKSVLTRLNVAKVSEIPAERRTEALRMLAELE